MICAKSIVVEEGQNGRTCTLDDPAEGQKSAYDYICPCLESDAPFEALVIMLGTNDLKVQYGLTAEQIAMEMDRLLTRAEGFIRYRIEPEIFPKILLISPIYIGENIENCRDNEMMGGRRGVEKSRQLAPYMEAVAKKHGCRFMDGAKVSAAGKADQVHMDPEGHARMAEAVYEKLKEML